MIYSNETPAVALLVGQQKEIFKDVFRELLAEMGLNNNVAQIEILPDTIRKPECSKLTGFSINTINRFICDKTIPHYKMNSRVLFKRNEIEDWMLSNRIDTSAEFVSKKEVELSKKL